MNILSVETPCILGPCRGVLKKGEIIVETAPETTSLPSPQKTDAFWSVVDSTNTPPGQPEKHANVTPTPTQENPKKILYDPYNNNQSTLSPGYTKDNVQPFAETITFTPHIETSIPTTQDNSQSQ